MKKPWFKEFGWVYKPISWQGWFLLILTIFFCFQVFIAIDRNSHSISDTFYGIFPYFVPALLLLGWIASKTSGYKNND